MKLIDLTGQRFEKVVVISRGKDYISSSGRKKVRWLCQCDCGNEFLAYGEDLRSGDTKSCGCLIKRKPIDMVGQKIGRLIVIEQCESKNNKAMWKCKCDCGNERIVSGQSLRKGMTMSCGCLRNEVRRKAIYIHGMSQSKIHKTWRGLFQRCENPTASHYERYGGRGIGICEEWKGENGFVNFYEWSMKNGYSDNLELDRINNNKGYSPDNCRWISHIENCHNRNARKDSTTGYAGIQERVMRTGRIKYRVSITANGRRINLGHYETLMEAVKVRKEAEEKYWNK